MTVFNYNTEAVTTITLLKFIELMLDATEYYNIKEDFMYPQKCQFRIEDKADCPLYTIITNIYEFEVIKTYIDNICNV